MAAATQEFCRLALGLSWYQALAVALAAAPLGALWLFACQRLRPGAARLLAVAPLVAANLVLPRLFCRWTDINTTVIASFAIAWLCSFKAISWALGRGTLCSQPYTLAQFVAVYTYPVTPVVPPHAPASPAHSGPASTRSRLASQPGGGSTGSLSSSLASGGPAGRGGGGGLPRRGSKGRLGDDAGGSSRMAQAWAGKHLLIGVVVALLRYELPGMVESFVYALGLYCLLSLIMDGPAALIISLTGLRVSPHFDRPWESTSVAAFWSKRWDLAAGNTLRQLVYDSVLDGSLLPPPAGAPHARPSPARQALGTAASFAASGLVHEGIFWYITGHTTGGIWFLFFFVQAPLIVLERLALGALKKRGVRVPAWLRTLVTVALISLTGQHLFWAPCKRWGVAQGVVKSTADGLLRTAARLRLPLPGGLRAAAAAAAAAGM